MGIDSKDLKFPKSETGASAKGARSVSVGESVIRSIISTGDGSQIFVGDYERLKDAYINPRSVFERVKLDRFVGRTWLEAVIDSFIEKHDRGYLIIEAPAGSGKTTFVAHLVKERGYIHHFVELAPGSDGVAPGLRNLSAQIVRTFLLSPNTVDEIIPGSASRPDYLQSLLFEAADRRDKESPEDKIVITIDGTDEAGFLAGTNALGLPKALPRGVYLIVTQRPVRVRLYVDSPREVFRFEVDDERNVSDMKTFLEAAAAVEPFSSLINGSRYTAQQFVNVLLSKGEGLWIYLHYVLSEIERGERAPLNLSALPQGIWQYYAQYWQRVRDEAGSEWNRLYLPVLSTMAATQEALSFELLCKLAGIETNELLQRVVTETWLPFLFGGNDHERKYRLYHASLREFFDGRVNTDQLTAQEKSLAVELSDATIEAHSRITDYYLNAWGGLAAGLPLLEQIETGTEDEAYGARHIVSHLEHAGRANEVHHLLRLERPPKQDASGTAASIKAALRQKWSTDEINREGSTASRAVNVWYEYRERRNDISGYLSDISRAWQLARQIPNGNHDLALGLPLEVRYALITASLHSLAGRIPPQLIVAAVERGAWPAVQALSVSRHITDVRHRAEALIGLVPYLPPHSVGEVKTEALSSLRLIPYKADPYADNEIERLTLFIALANLENEGEGRDRILDEALASTQRVENEEIQGRLLRLLIPHFQHRAQVLLTKTKEIGNAAIQMSVISALIPALPDGLLQDVVELALTIRTPHLRTFMLNEIILEPRANNKRGLLGEAVKSGRSIEDARKKVEALSRLLPSLDEVGKLGVVNEIIAAARSVDDEYRLWTLSELPFLLRSHTSEDMMLKLAEVALGAARNLEHSIDRATKLERLIPFAPENEQEAIHVEVMSMIRAEPNHARRVGLLQIISYHVTADKKADVLNEALNVAFGVSDHKERERTLSELIPCFDANEAEKVIGMLAKRSTDATGDSIAATASRDLTAEIVGKALVVASDREYYGSGSQSFFSLLSLVPAAFKESVLQRALIETLSMLEGERRNRALNAISRHLPSDTIREALKAVRSAGDEYEIGDALATLQVFIGEDTGEIVESVIEIARAVRFPDRAVDFVLPVAARVDTGKKDALIEVALLLIRSIKDNQKKTYALVRAVSILPSDTKGTLVDEALNGIEEIEDEVARLNNLMPLLPHLGKAKRETTIQECFAMIRSVADVERKTGALRSLIKHLPEDQSSIAVNEGLDAARTVEDNGKRARTFSMFLPYLSGGAKTAVLVDATAAAMNAEDDDNRSWSLRALVTQMSEEGLSATMTAALSMHQVKPKAELLLALLAHYPAKESEIYGEILKCFHQSEEEDKSIILMSLAKAFPNGRSTELLNEARKLQGRSRAYVLSTFIRDSALESKLGLIDETIEAIKSISDSADRAHVVLYLTPHLVEELRQLTSLDGSEENNRSQLKELGSLFEDSLPMIAKKTRYEMLKEMHALAPAVSALAGEGALIEMARAIREVGNWWP